MNDSITQDIGYRQSLMKYAEKCGVSRANRKYNKSRSYICFRKQRRDGTTASLAGQSGRSHSQHPNTHTKEEVRRISNYPRRNPNIRIGALYGKLRQEKAYSRHPGLLVFRLQRHPAASRAYPPQDRGHARCMDHPRKAEKMPRIPPRTGRALRV